jgi:hypothetical protein
MTIETEVTDRQTVETVLAQSLNLINGLETHIVDWPAFRDALYPQYHTAYAIVNDGRCYGDYFSQFRLNDTAKQFLEQYKACDKLYNNCK